VTATSLNRSGGPAAAGRDAAAALCGDDPGEPWLLDVPGAAPPGGVASTVVDATGEEPVVLREGAVSRARVEACLCEGAGA
jgi:tRNA A37 threonylcarbamoyladenosine synthetase subunit TsaC/SUA5/YrdC